MTLVCGEQIAVFRDYILNCLYEPKHAEKHNNVTVVQWRLTSETLKKRKSAKATSAFYQAVAVQSRPTSSFLTKLL